ncbi:Hypothetical_protein [Hexamita inflata]|uniref:Hypothetical_protein n=1 Tax=Hexamita inflata TaxID=28002 RepID=A0AA86VT64_9EUKA|nr:Hypothetical protein HINF_LOCUS64713 [Hexamita inflata]
MYFAYTLMCYYNMDLDVYKDKSIIKLSSYYASGLLESEQKLQQLCGSQLTSPLDITLQNYNHDVIGSFQVIQSLFPTVEVVLNQDNLLPGAKYTFQDLLVKLTKSQYIEFSLNGIIMLTSSISSAKLIKDPDDIVIVAEKPINVAPIIIGVVLSVLVLGVLIYICVMVNIQKRKNENQSQKYSRAQINRQQQILRYKNASQMLFDSKKIKGENSVVSQTSSSNICFVNAETIQKTFNAKDITVEDLEPVPQLSLNGTKEFPLQVPSSLPKSQLKEKSSEESSEIIELGNCPNVLDFLQNKDVKFEPTVQKQEVPKEAKKVLDTLNKIQTLNKIGEVNDDKLKSIYQKLGIQKATQ